MVAVSQRGQDTRAWTAMDLLAMPDDLDHRYELVEGRLVKMWQPASAQPRTLMAAEVLDGGDVVPGFSIPVAQVCPERPRRRGQPGRNAAT